VSEPSRQHPFATRRELLTAGAVAGAAVLATPAVAVAASGGGPSPPTDDAAHLERVLSMAALAAYVYQQVFAEGVLTQSQRRALDGFAEQEQAHVIALRRAAAAAGTVVRPPTSLDVANGYLAQRGIGGRLGQLQGADDALDLLVSIERSSIGSCYVALLGLTGSAAIALVASIMANDAQHEAVVTLQRPTLTLADAAPFPLVSGVH
jgi:hypothetical protein